MTEPVLLLRPADYRRACRHLTASDPVMASIIDRHGYSAAFCLIAVVVASLGMWFQGRLKADAPDTASQSDY